MAYLFDSREGHVCMSVGCRSFMPNGAFATGGQLRRVGEVVLGKGGDQEHLCDSLDPVRQADVRHL